ncbi:MAG: hypothetical protein IJ946_08550 [Clostridia bacterium]|nr:hypothetical protein [Clostridia bacterium]
MKSYIISSENGKRKVLFNLSDEAFVMTVVNNGEEYTFNFADGFFTEHYSKDWGAKKNYNLYNFYHNATKVTVNDNTIEFVSNPKFIKEEKELSNITVTNRFTLLENQASVIQETFFEVDDAFYDCCHRVARAKIDLSSFETIENEKAGFCFNISDLERSNIGYPEELVLRGKNRYLKVNGGLVTVTGTTLEAHYYSFDYDDTPSYYNSKNPIYTVYSFEECETPELPVKEKSSVNDNDILYLNSGILSLKIKKSERGIAFINNGNEMPVTALAFKNLKTNETLYADTLRDFEKVQINKNGNCTEFLLFNPRGITDVCLKIKAQAIEDKNRFEWEVEVINNSEDYSLFWCNYPRLYVECGKNYNLFMPENGGTEFCGFSNSDLHYISSYPDGFYGTMSYMALYSKEISENNGIYFAIHDSLGSRKEFSAAGTQSNSLRFNCRFYAENIGESKNSNRLPGKAIFQIFTGDWFDATELYSEFVRNECYWTKRNIKDKNTPLWMQDIPFWIMDWVPYDNDEKVPTKLRTDSDVIGPNDWYEKAIRLQKEFGVPIGYHVYNWHKIPFNNDYPHFMPAKEKFINGLKELKKSDIRVMPYINVLLWDTKDKENEDFEFETLGKPGAVKKEDGTPQTFSFESKEKDGNPVELAAMCPSSKIWREKLTKLITEMFNELDIDAIYLDQLAARVPLLCMDKTHNHPAGGGSWWAKEYNDLAAELNAHKPKDKAFTTECNAEVYAGQIDGFLSWTWMRSTNEVPAFMRIYYDIIKVFGRNTGGATKHCHMQWKYNLAQSLLCGQQMGWVNADLVDMPDRLEFTKKLVRFRYENREFFRNARVMRPPTVLADKSHRFYSDIAMRHVGVLIQPYICVGALQNGNKNMIILVNTGKEKMTDVVTFNSAEYTIADNRRVYGDGSIKMLNSGSFECTIDGESYICIEWNS